MLFGSIVILPEFISDTKIWLMISSCVLHCSFIHALVNWLWNRGEVLINAWIVSSKLSVSCALKRIGETITMTRIGIKDSYLLHTKECKHIHLLWTEYHSFKRYLLAKTTWGFCLQYGFIPFLLRSFCIWFNSMTWFAKWDWYCKCSIIRLQKM